MNNKKSRRGFTPRVDRRRPSKPDTEAGGTGLRYEGPAKSDEAPTADTDRVKGEFVKSDVRRPRPVKGTLDLPQMQGSRHMEKSMAPEQYVRLRIRVRDGRMSVIDSHLVDGPLGQIGSFSGTNAYEVTLGDRLLHAGSLPDLGIQRSFVDPDGPEAQRAHHYTERRVLEFSARVPAHEVTPETIGDIAVRLHRVKGQARSDRLSDLQLSAQFEREMRPIAEIRGLPASALPAAIEERGAHTPRA